MEDYAAEGRSLARVDGKVVFIEGAVPGDVVDVQLTKNKSDWAEGHTLFIKSFSPDRVQPFCSHFGVCGGCQWQMLPYEQQLKYKQKQVTDNLTRIGRIRLPEIMPIVGADDTRYYRNKMEYTFATRKYIPSDEFRKLKAEGIDPDALPGAAGFHARGFFDKVVEIDTCHLQEEPTNLIRKFAAAYTIEKGVPLIVYVSCNPATQARDLALLDEKYEVTKIQPVDMFPHTLHIENVVQLKLRKEA